MSTLLSRTLAMPQHAVGLKKVVTIFLVLVSALSFALGQDLPVTANAQLTSRASLKPAAGVADAAQAEDAAAKDAAQNPVSPAISLPFQNNTLYGVGPYRRAADAFFVEPVVPFKLSENWAVITRTIIPVGVFPRVSPSEGVDYGLGNIQPQIYLSPIHQGKFLWGAGPQLWLPTAIDSALGTNKWGGGPAFAGLVRHGAWLGGVLLNNQFAGTNHKHINQLTLNPFVFYNLPHGWYLVTSPVITSDWTASRNERWTVPMGAGVGRVFKIGNEPVNARTQFLNNVRTTIGGPDWQFQTQLQLLFLAKSKK